MLKLTILLALVTLGFAQEDSETPQNKEDETITVLNMSNQGITSLNEYDFSKYPLLEELDLSNNDLQHIKEDTFIKNVHLKKLNLSGNKNLKLPEFSTLVVANIEELDLSNCNIEELPSNIFDVLPELKIVDLSDNPLQENGIKLSTLLALVSPKKIILPHIDEPMIREICNDLDIIIGIKSQDYSDSIQCADVREGTWQNTVKEESPDDVQAEHQLDEEIHPDEENVKDGTEAEADIPDDVNIEMKRQAIPDDAGDDQTVGEETDGNTEGNVAPEENNTEPEASPPENEENAAAEAEPPLPENEEKAETEAEPSPPENETESEPSLPEDSDTGITANPELTADEANPEDTENNKPDGEDTVPDTDVPLENVEVPIPADTDSLDETTVAPPEDIPDAVNGKDVPDSIDGRFAQVDENQEKVPEKVDEEKQSPEGEPPKPLQRGVIDVPQATDTQNTEPGAAIPEGKKSQRMLDTKAVDPKAAESEPPSSTGTNVLIFLVVAVVVAGVAAFGYKFYKSRKYEAAGTAEPVERELKEIVVDRRANGPNNAKEVIEEEPLMENRHNSVEIKEIDETNGVAKNEVPKTTASSLNNSGPYVPTTTPVKPPHENKNDDKTQI